MVKILRIPDVEKDIKKALNYYIDKTGYVDISNRLSSIIKEMFGQLERSPGLAKPYDPIPDVVQFPLRTFPYTMYFRKNNNELQLIALAFRHQKRDPEILNNLIRKRIKT